MNWIKTHPRAFIALIGAALVAVGLLLMVPRSPWSLVVIGGLLLFGTMVTMMPADRLE